MTPTSDPWLDHALTVLTWDAGDGTPTVEAVERRLRREGVEPHAWSNGPGDRYATHEPGYAKLLMCAAGSITFFVGPPETSVELRPGDGFVLEAGTPHAAVVGASGCTCLEGHRE